MRPNDPDIEPWRDVFRDRPRFYEEDVLFGGFGGQQDTRQNTLDPQRYRQDPIQAEHCVHTGRYYESTALVATLGGEIDLVALYFASGSTEYASRGLPQPWGRNVRVYPWWDNY